MGFLSGIGAKLAIGGVILALIGGGLLWINNAAYDRGVEETKAEMRRLIEEQRQQVKADVERLRNMTPTEIDLELWKRCMKSAGEDVCGPRP